MKRDRHLAWAMLVLALGWTLSVAALVVGWKSVFNRSQLRLLELRTELAARDLGGGATGRVPDVEILPDSLRLLPEGSPPERLYLPWRGEARLVAERSLPGHRIVRAELPEGSGDLPASTWTFSVITAASGTLLALGLLLWLLRRERRRTNHLVEVARTAGLGRSPPPAPPGTPGEDADLVATLGSDLRRRRVLAGWRERRMGRLLDPLSEGVVLLDGGLRVVVCNLSAAGALGFRVPKAAARARPIVSLVEDLGFLDDLRRAVARGLPTDFELERAGRVHWIRLWPVPADAEGEGWLLSLLDVTDRRRAERLQDRLVSDASHEFKTPLTSILGWTETLLDDEEDDFRRKALGRITLAARHLEEVVRDLLDLGRLAEVPERSREPVDLGAACRDAIGTVEGQAGSKRTRITLDCPREAVVPGHRGRLVRAFLNLLSNAVRHSPEGEEVVLEVRREGAEWVVEVRDRGPGVPPDILPHLFERFYRADHGRSRDMGGTGLGLAIVKETAELHGGRAEVESEFGRGARFRVVLPAE